MANDYPISREKYFVEIEGMDGLGGWIGDPPDLEYGTEAEPIYDSQTERARYLPGRKVIPAFKIARMFDADKRLQQWADEGPKQKLSGSVIYVDYTGEEVRRNNWTGGWVQRYKMNDRSIEGADGVATESVVIVAEDMFIG
ncbi:MAG TPA: hypothetical protein DDW52_28065 [Planctomycetaceae bacterium]|nr:hypothetical protein [Planctomycetaceae bacterium]